MVRSIEMIMSHYSEPSVICSSNRSPGTARRLPYRHESGLTRGGNDILHHPPAPPPAVMPVFPLRPSGPGPGPHYSSYSPSHFNIDKRCQHKCSWKCCSIALICLCAVLTVMLAYFGAMSSIKSNVESSGCIVVEDARVVAQDSEQHSTVNATSQSYPPTEPEWIVTSTMSSISQSGGVGPGSSGSGAGTGAGPASGDQRGESRDQQWPSLVEISDLNYPYTLSVPPFQFWNSEFRNKRSIFIRFNFSVPLRTNFAFYGRRNVAPSITQYNFAKFIKGSWVDHRLKRSIALRPDADVELLAGNSLEPTVHGADNATEHVVKRRSAPNTMVNVTVLQYMEAGRWFLAIYNDDTRPNDIVLAIEEAEDVPSACPNDCSGRGSCYLGKCDCIDGYNGPDCSKSVCPVLCSNHGKYGGGLCHCEEGWKGFECDIPQHDCQVSDCSGHGTCVSGNCVCQPGWKGPDCSIEDCPDPTCSGHGVCIDGKCYCKAGWQGSNCSLLNQQVYKCLPTCSNHGTYDLDSGTCVCDDFWTGENCSKAVCSLDCGPHGHCSQGQCLCDHGWTGKRCDSLPCDVRCSEHGQCKNGTCVCSQGWNGRHCTLAGCLNSCNKRGSCSLESGEYQCVCDNGWAGPDCSVRLELNCNDKIDNDKDGMVDCSDSECCTHPACKEHIMCLASNDPVEVLLRKQPPSVTASFYQRVRFLVEDNSVQSYAHEDEYSENQFWISFTPRRVSVMRGQVLSPQGLGIIGIRVSVDRNSRFGFTLTRAGGWFDVLVNGGGAVTLQFQRSPFQPLTRTVFVPWNQIVVLPPITMQLSDDTDLYRENSENPSALALGAPGLATALHMAGPCVEHDEELLTPIIMSTWMPEKVGGMPGRSLIFAETQTLQESIQIPGSELHLMYRSSLSSGYLSILLMHLTHSSIPPSLVKVHVRVEIEGFVHSKIYEADPNLTHTFAWNRRNVYKQKVYGVAQALVSIGYEHSTCKQIVWETQTATLQAFDVDISDVGGWSLDVHHHYNFNEGILQKGDGSIVHFKHQFPRMIKTMMGTGLQRPLLCKDCDGLAKDARLLTPVSLTSGPDGSLYIGDFNLIRRLTPDGKVYTVLQLSASQVSYQYHLSISPADGHLYISDPERHQILRILSLDPVPDPNINWEAAIGSGERCIPGDETNCGDEGPALAAKLAYPKGIAISADRTMYIADGTNIRSVDPAGIIHTLIGHHGHHNVWQPIPCRGSILAHEAQLQWPTGLALSPLDGSLHFIDDRLVLKLTADLKVKVVAGIPLHCNKNHRSIDQPKDAALSSNESSAKESKATGISLGAVLSIAFSPSGQLFIADSDSQKVNGIRIVDSAGRMDNFAGHNSRTKKLECDCSSSRKNSCLCPSPLDKKGTLLSTNVQFSVISAITVSPDGVLNVADQGNLKILALEYFLPTQDDKNEYRIPYPAAGEMYVFNRFGQHIATNEISTGKTLYSFFYSKNGVFGKLSTVTDASGNKILFLRDYSDTVSAIENTQDHKSDLKISPVGYLIKFSDKGHSEVILDYDSETGLLTSKADPTSGGGATFLYHYNEFGRVYEVILPTGETLKFKSHFSTTDELEVKVTSLTQSQVVNNLTADSKHWLGIKMEGHTHKKIILKDGLTGDIEAINYQNGSFSIRSRYGEHIKCSALARHPLLEHSLPTEAELLPLWSHQSVTRGSLVNNMYWKYGLIGKGSTSQKTLLKQLIVNNSQILSVEYELSTGQETIYDVDKLPLLSISYNNVRQPVSWKPGQISPIINISYDRFNRVERWQWGVQSENYSYDHHGLLSEIKSHPAGSTQLTFNDKNMLTRIQLPTGRKFGYGYDEEGGLRYVSLPSGTRHIFNIQPSLGFIRYTYTPPDTNKAYLQQFSYSGALLQTIYPGDGARVLYRYHPSGQLAEIVHGDGKTTLNYWADSGLPSQVVHFGKDFEYRCDSQYSGGLLVEERITYGPKTGLNNAKIMYEYDSNFRPISISGRIGGQNLLKYPIEYNPKTGAKTRLGQFLMASSQNNVSVLSDDIASFSRTLNEYFQVAKVAVTIHKVEVFKMEFVYDSQGRVSQTRTDIRNVGVNKYTNLKNYTWDADGQLIGVESQEPWSFTYDANGNMLSLTYKENTISMKYNKMDQMEKFGEGVYRYDNHGLVVQNALEEKFHYNAKGLLVRVLKRGRFDVHYFYDHIDRLVARKDNYGNVTQFFYTNQENPNIITQIFSPRDGKLTSLVYDDRGHLIYAQYHRHKFYVATDQCGTPVMIFNQYGEAIREIMRSPYGHIVYDSNPYLYLPIDYCGGLLDQVTSLVHMSNGKVYDPLIGQWMSPTWKDVLSRVTSPRHIHLYRFNGNDPVNVNHQKLDLTDETGWLSKLGYNIKSLAPLLEVSKNLPMSLIPSTRMPAFSVTSGFLSHLIERLKFNGFSSLSKSNLQFGVSSISSSLINPVQFNYNYNEPESLNDGSLFITRLRASAAESPFGHGILVSRTKEGRAIIHSIPTANTIYRDVLTSVFNNTYLLPFTIVVHGALQDAFHFVKEEAWQAAEDKLQLKRFDTEFNITFHEREGETEPHKVLDVRIHRANAIINLRYGTTVEREKQRLLHHAKSSALRKAWHREHDALRIGLPTSREWSATEVDEISKAGYASGYDGEYITDVQRYPELAEDPFNIRFIKKSSSSNR
nr:PREDICTED: teneurin-a isoform X2 [Bemisia tabaci]